MNQSLETIRQALDIVQVIGEVVALKKSGQNFFGLCPFHSEKSPSFSVSPAKQLFHCFGCKAGGDVIKFIQIYNGYDFSQALEDAAKRAGITLDRFKRDPQWQEGLDILEEAARFFSENLYSKEGLEFRHYLKQRSVPEDLWESFRLGAHTQSSQSLAEHLKARSMNRDLASQLGLLSRSASGDWYDRFQGRLIFPILDDRGAVRGFGGRILGQEQPKYLNSPKSRFFDKGRLFYGMHLASKAASRKGYVVIVEGYLDVLALVQYGVTNVVGSMGTSLTLDQVRLCKRWAQKVVSLFDADAAGLAATERNLGLFFKEGVEAKVAMIPSGKDPDAFLHESDLTEEAKKTELRKVFESARPALNYLIERKVLVEGTATGRGKEIRALVNLIDQMPDELQRMVVKRDIASQFGLPESLVMAPAQGQSKGVEVTSQRSLGPDREPNFHASRQDRTTTAGPSPSDRFERETLRFLVQTGDVYPFALGELRACLSSHTKWGEILVRLLDLGLDSKDIASLGWLGDLLDADDQALVREWALEARPEGSLEDIARDLFAGLQRSFVRRESERLQQELLGAEQNNDLERVRKILAEKQDLHRLFQTHIRPTTP